MTARHTGALIAALTLHWH